MTEHGFIQYAFHRGKPFGAFSEYGIYTRPFGYDLRYLLFSHGDGRPFAAHALQLFAKLPGKLIFSPACGGFHLPADSRGAVRGSFYDGLCAGLVHKIYRLIRELPVRNVAHGKLHRGVYRGGLYRDAVMRLIPRSQAFKNCGGLLRSGLAHEHGRKAPFERRIIFNVFAVFFNCGGAYYAKLAPCKRGLHYVRGVNAAFARAGADYRMDLIYEEYYPAVFPKLIHERLQALLEFAAVFRSGYHGSEIERKDPHSGYGLRHVSFRNALRDALRYCGLAHARLAYKDGIVLRPAAEHCYHAVYLILASDHGIEPAAFRKGGEIA